MAEELSKLSLEEKVVSDAISAQKAAVSCIKQHRHEDFLLEHCRPFVDDILSIKA